MFEWMMDPTAWLGFADTGCAGDYSRYRQPVVYCHIGRKTSPPEQRDRARYYGLALALLMRFGLLASLSHMVSFTQPFYSLSGRCRYRARFDLA